MKLCNSIFYNVPQYWLGVETIGTGRMFIYDHILGMASQSTRQLERIDFI